MFSMFKPQRSPVVNWLLNKGRMRFGCQLVSRTQGMRPVLRGLKQGMSFYYLPDEDFGPKHSVFTPFFGVATATLPSLGRLTETAGAVVVPCFTRLTRRGYDVTLRPPLENFPTGDRLADAARMNAVLEEGIRLAPEQYMWTFKLFKTRPDNAPSPYDR
jgi:lauroyl/myristoyl acyltransferase